MIEHKAPPPLLLMAHAKLASKIFITHNLFLMTLWEHLIITILSSVLFRRAILIFLNQYTDLYINQKSFLTGLEIFYSYSIFHASSQQVFSQLYIGKSFNKYVASQNAYSLNN